MKALRKVWRVLRRTRRALPAQSQDFFEICDKTRECLDQLGIRPDEVDVSVVSDTQYSGAIVFVDVRPHLTRLSSYAPHVEHFIIARLWRKYGIKVTRVPLQWHPEAAFDWLPPVLNAEKLYRVLHELDAGAKRTPEKLRIPQFQWEFPFKGLKAESPHE